MAAFVIDILILWVPASIFKWSAPFLGVRVVALEVIDFIYATIVWAVYYGYMEGSRFQATFGKQVLGLNVVNYNGGRISFLKAVERYLWGFISALPLGLGMFMIGWTKKKQGIHDMLAKCLVIRNKPQNP